MHVSICLQSDLGRVFAIATEKYQSHRGRDAIVRIDHTCVATAISRTRRDQYRDFESKVVAYLRDPDFRESPIYETKPC